MNANAPQISSITKGPRQSNFELLRILAMFLVLVVHADFFSLDGPTLQDFQDNPLSSFTRTFFEAVSIVCVNVFILISGWFGIKPTMKGFCNFIFQCAFFLFSIYLTLLILGQTTLTLKGIAGCFCLTPLNWFIKAYSALYILSPVLNAFVEKASKKQLKYMLIAFFVFQTIWGWSGAAKFVAQGYSTFSFIGLYLLARYIRLFGNKVLTNWGGVIYIVSILLNTIVYYFAKRYNIPIPVFEYVNPLVIIGALGLLLWFSKKQVNTNRFINWVAKSSFAVFLLHTNPNIVLDYYRPLIKFIYQSFSGIGCLLVIFGISILIFIIAILLDQPRKWLWRPISKLIDK